MFGYSHFIEKVTALVYTLWTRDKAKHFMALKPVQRFSAKGRVKLD